MCIQWQSPPSSLVSPPRWQSSPEWVSQTRAVSPSAQEPSWTDRSNGKNNQHQHNLDHNVIDDKYGMNSFIVCEPLRSAQSLLSPRPERAEPWASPPLPWALWWSARWGLHSPRRGWRSSWLCRRNAAWTESPRSYRPLDSLWLSWPSCCCRQDCPEDTKTSRGESTAAKSFLSVYMHGAKIATTKHDYRQLLICVICVSNLQ